MKRRQMLAALAGAAVAASLPARAQQAPSVSIVKLVNFTCPICRASESQDIAIRQRMSELGGRFVLAPLPGDDVEGEPWRELLYYSLRNLSPAMEAQLRKLLYDGSQDLALIFHSPSDLLAYLENELGNKPEWPYVRTAITQLESDAVARGAYQRAARLAVNSGAQDLPTYIVLSGASIHAVLDAPNHGNNSLLGLQQAVLRTVNQLSSVRPKES